ncbi:zinc-dependent alcohol dehydrogenase family protein [Phyllobacterium endophyticum]|nr:NAD(P)-dependent alcohol dehydrogenase [Phyllobacterium endophyticum]MBB3236842.1 NADPH:quinone reductase-like Zn-dependent oxidoreductase [Phyllobacterium endophyticum]
MTKSSMRTYRLEELGGASGVTLKEEAIPSPAHGQVLLRVRASSINFRDIIIANGWYPLPIPVGRVPFSDGAGEVIEVGHGVKRFAVGDRVLGNFFPNLFGGKYTADTEQWVAHHDGWLTEYKVVDAEAVVAVPEHLSFEEAASLPCAALTAWSAVKGVRAGDTVLTQGTGGVSLFALQLAKAFGAKVVATTSSREKAERLKSLGADHVIDYKASPEWGAAVKELCGGSGVDHVVEVGGPETLTESLKAVALGGHISIVGVLAGVAGGIDFMSLFQSQATLRPTVVGNRLDLEEMLRVFDQHSIKPVIDNVYEFEDLKSAWDHFAARNVFGKVVIRH